MSENFFKGALVKGENGAEEIFFRGSMIKAANGDTFETHAGNVEKHIPASSEDGGILVSKNGGAPEWANPAELFPPIDAMSYKGKVASASELPADADVENGWTYKVTANGDYKGHVCEPGDMLVARKEGYAVEWDAYQANIDGAVIGPESSVNENLAVFDGATGKALSDSGIAKTDLSDVIGKKHQHANAQDLAKISSREDGALLWDGQAISGIRLVDSAEAAAGQEAPAGTIFLVVEQM